MKLCDFHEFEKLVSDFGVVLELEKRTSDHKDCGEARVRVGVFDHL